MWSDCQSAISHKRAIHCHENFKSHKVEDIQVEDGKCMLVRTGYVGRGECFRIVSRSWKCKEVCKIRGRKNS
jgi:hypothetical protein